MLKYENGELIQIRDSVIGELINVVTFQFIHYCEVATYFHNKYQRKPSVNEIMDERPEYVSQTLIAQAFTAMVLEAFYFDYKHGKESRANALEWSKQSPVKKFEQLATTYLGIENPKSLEVHEKISYLNRLRKMWNHDQSAVGSGEPVFVKLSPDACLNLLLQVFSLFSEKDPSCISALYIVNHITNLQRKYKGFSGENK